MMHDPSMPWKTIIKSSADLVTTSDATRAGFAEQVTAKAAAAQPFVRQAMALKTALETINSVEKLIELTEYRDSIVAACGLSIKARGHLKAEEESLIADALMALYKQTADQFPEATSDEEIAAAYRQQIVYRYLLTAGDTLGGSMRNYVGALGARKLSTAILEALTEMGYRDVDISTTPAGKATRITWASRLIVFDRTPTLMCGDHTVVANNIDVCLLDISQAVGPSNIPLSKDAEKSVLQTPECYLACGELKGGIDPAGADEHWKTTGSALDRISQVFASCGQHQPKLFFVGGAIAPAMAGELYTRLSKGDYSFAANLTQPAQLQALARWLIGL